MDRFVGIDTGFRLLPRGLPNSEGLCFWPSWRVPLPQQVAAICQRRSFWEIVWLSPSLRTPPPTLSPSLPSPYPPRPLVFCIVWIVLGGFLLFWSSGCRPLCIPKMLKMYEFAVFVNTMSLAPGFCFLPRACTFWPSSVPKYSYRL